MTLFSYRWLTRLLCPLLWLWDHWRAYKQPIYRPHRAERWARQLPPTLSKHTIWIHAVSVGETQASAPLIRALLLNYPDTAVLLTHMTPTGRETGASVFANEIAARRLQQCYLPYDVAGLTERFLNHFKPVAGAFMETEIWPNYVAACHAASIPVGLANARLSEKTLHKTLRFQALAETTFNAFAWVAAQSERDAQRLAQLRCLPISVTGNLKFDATMNAAQWRLGQAFKAQQGRLTIALASTREGEEHLLLATLAPWLAQQKQAPLILLIPRHPKRAAELLTLLNTLGMSAAQRGLNQLPSASTQVYLCDSLGEMWFYYGASDFAIVGGGWAALGGQNLIEPCMAGCATLVGPHMFNFADATRLALADEALIQTELTALTQHLDSLLVPHARLALCQRGQQFASKHVGATAKTLVLIEKALEQRGAKQRH